MTPRFIDTSYLIALLATDDAHHQRAVSLRARIAGSPLVTTDFVLVEFADGFVAEHARPIAVAAIAALRADLKTTVVPASRDLVDRGLELFSKRPDKRWSLTDCISFVVMRDEGVTDALTSDTHFPQAGFRALLLDAGT